MLSTLLFCFYFVSILIPSEKKRDLLTKTVDDMIAKSDFSSAVIRANYDSVKFSGRLRSEIPA